MTTGNVTTYYYLGGKLVAMREGTELRYVHQDHLTGTALVTSANGTQMGTIKYYPYGDCRNSTGTLGTDKLFTGQRLDGTGLYYYGARYYDATIGRFISADTIIPDPMNPQSYNRYSYVLNNPLRYIDPSGHVVSFSYGGVSIPTYLWYETDPEIWILINDLIASQGIMDELVEVATKWESFEKQDPYKAKAKKRSKTVYTVSSEPTSTLPNAESPENKSLYIASPYSEERYEWVEHSTYYPFREGNKWEGAWSKDYGYGKEPILGDFANTVLGCLEVAVGSTGLTLSVIFTGGTFAETGGASAMLGVPAATASYNILREGLYRISEGRILIPDIPFFWFPY